MFISSGVANIHTNKFGRPGIGDLNKEIISAANLWNFHFADLVIALKRPQNISDTLRFNFLILAHINM